MDNRMDEISFQKISSPHSSAESLSKVGREVLRWSGDTKRERRGLAKPIDPSQYDTPVDSVNSRWLTNVITIHPGLSKTHF